MKLFSTLIVSIYLLVRITAASGERAVYLEVEAEKVFQGEIYSFQLVAYPVGVDFKEKIEKASSEKFVDGLKIIKITNSGFSENNADAFVFQFEALVLNERIDSLIEVGEEKISFEYKGDPIVPFTQMSESILIRDLVFNASKPYYVFAIISLLTVLLIGILGKKYVHAKRESLLLKNKRKELIGKLNHAKTREEYEYLYSRRSELFKILNLIEIDQQTLVATMEELQYKRAITADELNRMEQEFEKIRKQVR